MTAGGGEVLVVGAGVAGLASAAALSGAGARVTVVERRAYVGGRAYSYVHPALEEEVDSQHIFLGCCTNLIDLCERAGVAGKVRWYESIPLLEPGVDGGAARRSEIGPGMLPAPSHATMSFLRARMLGWRDKLAVARGLMEFVRGYPAGDEEAFSRWLERTGQTSLAIRHFWEPVVLAALNDGFERCSTKYVGKVLHEMLLRNPAGVRFGIPTEPLSRFLAGFAALAERSGARFRYRESVEGLERRAGGWRVRLGTGEVMEAERVVLALPFEQVGRLLAGVAGAEGVVEGLGQFSHAPITTIHLWFDRAVADVDTAGLLDTRIQWMFNKTRIRGGGAGEYVELTISGSFQELGMGRERILAGAVEEFGRFFPRAREARVVKAGVLKEARATFSVVPGLDRWRPAADALGEGLYLAGDWTQTGWPATMEGAARSGRLAAEAMARDAGGEERFVTGDLAAGGLMRWLVRG